MTILQLAVLSSGSTANCYVVWTDSSMVLVDAGLSGRKTKQAMESFSLDMEDVDALFISHEHSDHIRGAGVLARKLGIPVYMTARTYFAAEHRLGKVENVEFIAASDERRIGDIEVENFPTPHDAAEPVGFLFRWRDQKIGLCSDLGHVPEEVVSLLHDPDILVMESNYHPDMLRDGPYPPQLKAQIASSIGHLSNLDSGKAIARIIGPRSSDVLLAHISQNNNTPDRALRDVERALRFRDLPVPSLHPTWHEKCSGPYCCRRSPEDSEDEVKATVGSEASEEKP